jgi:hypothetical protein
MRTLEHLAQSFADEIASHVEHNRKADLRRQELYGVWRRPLDAIQVALDLLGKELTRRLDLTGATMVNVYVSTHHRLVFHWRSELGDLRIEFEPTNQGVYYRVVEGPSVESSRLHSLDSIFDADELACGIVISQLRRMILPRLS